MDLQETSARLLVVGGRLCFWLPDFVEAQEDAPQGSAQHSSEHAGGTGTDAQAQVPTSDTFSLYCITFLLYYVASFVEVRCHGVSSELVLVGWHILQDTQPSTFEHRPAAAMGDCRNMTYPRWAVSTGTLIWHPTAKRCCSIHAWRCGTTAFSHCRAATCGASSRWSR